MKIPVAPYLYPGPETVEHRGWSVRLADELVELPSEMKLWDYQSVIGLTFGIQIDRALLTRQCELGFDSELAVLAVASSTGTGIERKIVDIPIPLRDSYEITHEVDLESYDLGGRLTIETLVVVRRAVPLSELSPTEPGSILWRLRHSTHLEGIGGQFPTEAEDFALTRPMEAHAGWALKVDTSDLDALFNSSVRLTLNSGSSSVKSLLAGSQSQESKLLATMLDIDVTRQLVAAALSNEDIRRMEVDIDGTSIASVLRNLIFQLWPSKSTSVLYGWLRDSPERLETAIQSSRRFVP